MECHTIKEVQSLYDVQRMEQHLKRYFLHYTLLAVVLSIALSTLLRVMVRHYGGTLTVLIVIFAILTIVPSMIQLRTEAMPKAARNWKAIVAMVAYSFIIMPLISLLLAPALGNRHRETMWPLWQQSGKVKDGRVSFPHYLRQRVLDWKNPNYLQPLEHPKLTGTSSYPLLSLAPQKIHGLSTLIMIITPYLHNKRMIDLWMTLRTYVGTLRLIESLCSRPSREAIGNSTTARLHPMD
jgi:hypothetical protein